MIPSNRLYLPHFRASGVLLALFLLPSPSNGEVSPHSIQGLGLMASPYGAKERAMGNTGMAIVSKYGMSLSNPSRAAFTDRTSFLATLESDLNYLREGEISNRLTSSSIPFIGMNFPIGPIGNLGLSYFNRFNRNFSYSNPAAKSQGLDERYEYEGGITELGVAWAYPIFKYFSVGLNYNLLLGREREIHSARFDGQTFDPLLVNSMPLEGDTSIVRSRGGYPGISLTYRHKKISVGGSLMGNTDLRQTTRRGITRMDTPSEIEIEAKIPIQYAAGIAYKLKDYRTVAMDYSWARWEDIGPWDLHTHVKIGLGFEESARGGPFDPFYKKISYRGGLGYERQYIEAIDHFYISTGAGLPLGGRGSVMDLAFNYGHRKGGLNNLISEDYVKLSVSLIGVGVWGKSKRRK